MKTINILIVSRDRVWPHCLLTLALCLNACNDFVKIDPPQTDLIKATVFTDDNTATAAIVDIYYNMSQSGFASGDVNSISFLSALSSDELLDYASGGGELATLPFNQNVLTPQNSEIIGLWSKPYAMIYRANAAMEGLNSSTGVSEALRNQLLGEARFVRAFCHFCLTNMFGDVPLVTPTDYQSNSLVAKASSTDVYQQIIMDLIEAQTLLGDHYPTSDGKRSRPNKGAATALLARVYLYVKDWQNAELQATSIIEHSDMYALETDLNLVFYNNSTEAIWQLANNYYPNDFSTFYIFDEPYNGALRDDFALGFEHGDQRKIDWVDSVNTGSAIFYFPTKYKSLEPMQEFTTPLRLAEMYLIRAEARTQNNEVSAALNDINTIRSRAKLSAITVNTADSLMSAIEQERKWELFTEWGH